MLGDNKYVLFAKIIQSAQNWAADIMGHPAKSAERKNICSLISPVKLKPIQEKRAAMQRSW